MLLAQVAGVLPVFQLHYNLEEFETISMTVQGSANMCYCKIFKATSSPFLPQNCIKKKITRNPIRSGSVIKKSFQIFFLAWPHSPGSSSGLLWKKWWIEFFLKASEMLWSGSLPQKQGHWKLKMTFLAFIHTTSFFLDLTQQTCFVTDLCGAVRRKKWFDTINHDVTFAVIV